MTPRPLPTRTMPTHYKVRKGDTVESVADDFEVPVEKLRKWNHLRGTALTPGRTLVIYKPTSTDSAEAESSEAQSTTHPGQRRQRVAQGAERRSCEISQS